MMGAMQPVTRARSREDLTARLAERTLELVNIPSVSGEEVPILEHIAAALPEAWAAIDREDACLFASGPRRAGRPFVLLAGHVDTVPRRPATTPAPSRMRDPRCAASVRRT